MKMIEYNIEVARAKAPNNHKLDIYIISKYRDMFGKISEIRWKFDTVMPYEKDNTISQIHNVYGTIAGRASKQGGRDNGTI